MKTDTDKRKRFSFSMMVAVMFAALSLRIVAAESLDYIERIGVPAIRAHARRLTDRFQKELPALGYASVTPRGTDTPIVAFDIKDVAATIRKLSAANITATIIENEKRLRLAVSVFNDDQDVDHVLRALA